MLKLLFGFALAGLLLATEDHATPEKKAYIPYEQWTRELVESGKGDPLATTDVYVTIGERTLTFSPTADRSNIEGRYGPDDGETSITIDLKDPEKKVRRIFAVARDTYVALAVERGIPGSMSFDYVMIFGRRGEKDNTTINWCISRPLFTTTYEKRCNVMNIALPEGDTILMTLQRLTRRSNGDVEDIESHAFVNICPMPDQEGFMTESITNHYLGTLAREPKKPAAK